MQTCNKLKNHSPRPTTNLILKHEILSKDCDLFRVSLRRKIYFWQIVLLTILVVPSVSWFAYHQGSTTKDSLVLKGILGVGIICAIFTFLFLKSIEERILLIRGLGVQITNVNGLGQETSNFIPIQAIRSVYIFESFDGLRVRHFFNIKLRKENEQGVRVDLELEDTDKYKDNNNSNYKFNTNIIIFENLKPPVQFLKRLYHKIHESEIVKKFEVVDEN